MQIQNLLSIDPDKLFEDSSIKVIEDVQKKLQNEIERKREELRTMVGERYRDLIEAADTISQMKKLSEEVIGDVNKMKIATAELQEKHVLDSTIEFKARGFKSNSWTSVAAQIKVLIDITEYIWEAIDQSNFAEATSLFLMARNIKTSLEINPGLRTDKYFPVISRQWMSLHHFKDTILREAEVALKSNHLSNVSVNSLVSLALLESLPSRALLDRYLSLRSDALMAILNTNKPLDTATITQRLCDSYLLLTHSIIAIDHCFLEGGLLRQELDRRVGPLALPTLQLMPLDVPMALLPTAVAQFRPVVEHSIEPVSGAEVCEAVCEWLKWVRALVKEHGNRLLHRLSSLRSLQGLIHPPEVSEEWPRVAQRLRLPGLDLWTELFRSLVTARAQQLVSVHWDSALKALQQQIEAAIQAVANEQKQTEVDLVWHMWKEASSDLTNPNDLKSDKGLWLKSRGVTPRVAALCVMLERKVSALLADLASLCPDQELDSALLAVSLSLRTHQQITCSTLVTRLVEFVRRAVQEDTSEDAILMLAKFLQSIPDLCPSLGKCLSSVDTKESSWQETLAMLQGECVTLYQAWVSRAAQRALTHINTSLPTIVPDLHTIPRWEEKAIEEEGEAGEKVQSTLRVPFIVSLNLQSAIFQLSSVIGHATIPKQISEQLVDTIFIRIMEICYGNIQDKLTQTQYLQMLLDVKYLLQLFANLKNKDLKTKIQDTISKLESKIDPFDLNVLTPYINENVMKMVYQNQALVPGAGVGLWAVSGAAGVAPSVEEASVLSLSSATSTWFPLLHITAPCSFSPLDKPKVKKSSNSVINTTPESGPKQSSTSSFFGVMATEWFG